MAVIAGALKTMDEYGAELDAEDQHLLLNGAIKHTGMVNALLRDLALGLPLGASALLEDPSDQARRRFGLREGSGLD